MLNPATATATLVAPGVSVEFCDAVDSPRHPVVLPLLTESRTEGDSDSVAAQTSPGATLPAVDFARCEIARPAVAFGELFSRCKRAVEELIANSNSPFYLGVAINASARWHLDSDPHFRHYQRMFVLAQGPSSTVLDLEFDLICHFTSKPLLVNRAAGGTGLARGHRHAHLYVCVGGDHTRLAVAMTVRGRRRPGFCSNCLCPGRCSDCCR